MLSIIVLSMFSCSMHSQPNLIPYRKFDKWVYCDKNKKIIITPNHDYVEPFENSFARVELASEKFYINTKGEKVDESAVKK